MGAAPLVAQRPRAEVFAVVGQKSIAPLAQTRARAFHHFLSIEAADVLSHADASPMSERCERNVFHRSAAQSVSKTRVVDDAPVADIDAVVRIEPSGRDEMRCERRLLVEGQT